MPETSTHKIYYPALTDLPDVPADFQRSAVSVDTAITSVAGTKQNAPTNGTTMLTSARGQSGNPVTVWATAQNTTNSPTNGQNLQFQWVDTRPFGWVGSSPGGYRLRLHVDARENQPGQQIRDVAWAFEERRTNYGVYGYAQSTNRAVLVSGINGSSGNDIYLAWVSPYIRAHVDVTWVGDFQYVSQSSIRVKDVLENSLDTETLGDFLDRLKPKKFRYKSDPGLVSINQRGREHLGFIAEEVRDTAREVGLPRDIVEYDTTGQPSALNAVDLIAVLWGTVQDLRARVADLEAARTQ